MYRLKVKLEKVQQLQSKFKGDVKKCRPHKTRKIKVFHYADTTKKPEKTIIIDKFNKIYCFML